jgi:hypothetical protein
MPAQINLKAPKYLGHMDISYIQSPKIFQRCYEQRHWEDLKFIPFHQPSYKYVRVIVKGISFHLHRHQLEIC